MPANEAPAPDPQLRARRKASAEFRQLIETAKGLRRSYGCVLEQSRVIIPEARAFLGQARPS